MPLYTFGSGNVSAFRTDIAGATPVRIADLQEATVEFSSSVKELMGQNQMAVAVGRGETKITGKLKFGRQQGRILADLYAGVPLVSGQIDQVVNEKPAGGIAATVVVANNTGYLFDAGVVNLNNGVPFTKITTGTPVAGQYKVDTSTGTYTFAAADVTAAPVIGISYGFTVTGSGQRFSFTNQQQGIQPVFQLNLLDLFNGPQGLVKKTLILYSCIATKYSEGGKSGDFKIPEMDFQAFDPGTGTVFDWASNVVS